MEKRGYKRVTTLEGLDGGDQFGLNYSSREEEFCIKMQQKIKN